MNPIITEQIEKFKTGDFSGYESFYNETVNTVYTMLHTIINDQDVATSLVPQVYDRIYKNTDTLEKTEGFYQWTAELANEEALRYLQENHMTGEVAASPSGIDKENDTVSRVNIGKRKGNTVSRYENRDEQEVPESFYDYAAEDEALTITEKEVADAFFTMKLQEIVQTLTPMERVVFQDYYYFGIGVPEIATKTGCNSADIRRTLSRTRTSILHAITESAADAENADNFGTKTMASRALDAQKTEKTEKKYRLIAVPWLWIAYQNFLGHTLGIDTVSITGWSLGMLEQAGGVGMAAGANAAVAGQTGGAAGASTGIGQTGGAAGASAGIGQTGGAAGASAGIGQTGAAMKASANGIAKFLGTVGGKVAVGIIGAAAVVGIGLGIHHASSEPERHSVAIEYEDGGGELRWEDGPAPVQEAEPVEEVSWVDLKLEQTRKNVDSYRTTGKGTRNEDAEIGESLAPYERKNCFYAVADINGDGMEDIYFGYWNGETRQIEIRHTYERDDIDGIVTYYDKNLYLSEEAEEFLYDKVDSQFELISDYMDNTSSGGEGYLKIQTGGGIKYYKVNETTWFVHGGSDGTVNYDDYNCDFLLRLINDDDYSVYFQEVSASEFESYKATFTYKKLEWHPLFDDETILNEDSSIPDADGRF